MDLKEQDAIGDAIDTHWYYVSKARMLRDHVLGLSGGKPLPHVLDVGAGAGWFSRWLLEQGLADSATCVDPGYDRDWDESVGGRSLTFRRQIDHAETDLILFMDVLEHVEDDAGLLSSYLARTPQGTPAFITVPAFQFMWSAHDVYLEHYRRYTRKSLARTIAAADAQVVTSHYYFGAVLPIAMAVRFLRRGGSATQSDMRPVSAPVNSALLGICAVERRIMRANLLAGLSVVSLCRR